MFGNTTRLFRLIALIASGAVVFQATTGCTQTLQAIQTGLLAALTGAAFYLAQNV